MSWSPVGTVATKVPLTVALCSSTSLTCDGRELARVLDDWRLSQCLSCNPDTEPVVELSVTVRHCECRAVVPTHAVELPAHVTKNTDLVLPMMVTEPRTFPCRGPSLAPRRAAAPARQTSMARSTTPRRERTAPAYVLYGLHNGQAAVSGALVSGCVRGARRRPAEPAALSRPMPAVPEGRSSTPADLPGTAGRVTIHLSGPTGVTASGDART